MVLVACACAAIGGCFTTTGEKVPPQPPFDTDPDVSDPRFGVFVPERVDAVLGERVVIPIELAGAYRPADVGSVRLDDGRSLATSLVWLTADTQARPGRSWLPASPPPLAIGADEAGAGIGQGRWVLVLDPPIDAVGQGFWLAGRRVPVNWLPDPGEVARRVPGQAWASPLPAGIRRAASLQRMLTPLRSDPATRWRARLVSGVLEPATTELVVDPSGSPLRAESARQDTPFEHDALDAIARFTEARWLVGLARLYEVDTDLNLAVRQKLSTVVDFGDSAIAPVWSTDRDRTDRLLLDLTDQTLSPRERARRAAAWLTDQPAGVAWILSDAGRQSIRGEPVTTVGLLNAAWRSSLASLEPWAGTSNLDLQPIPALTVRIADVVSRPEGASRSALLAEIGDGEFQLLAGAADLRASPPGLRIDALLLDLTLDELLGQRRTRALGDRTNALLYLDHRGEWVLYAECATQGRTPGNDDSLCISLGAVGSADEALVVASADGIVGLRDSSPAGSLAAPLDAEVARYEGGWSLRVVIPERFIEGRRTLRLGLERRDDRGQRSAWPRAMLPWQQSAPRAAIDLSAWDG